MPKSKTKSRPTVKKKINVIVDLSGGCVQDVYHDDKTRDVEIVFLCDRKDVSNSGFEVKASDGNWNHWIYTVMNSDHMATSSMKTPLRAAELYKHRKATGVL